MDHNSRDGDLSSTRKLLTNAWTKRVDTAEIEIKRFKLKRPLTNDCKVVFNMSRNEQHSEVIMNQTAPLPDGWVDAALFNKNRNKVPSEVILAHAGKHVA